LVALGVLSFGIGSNSPVIWGPGNAATVIPPVVNVKSLSISGGSATPATTTFTTPTAVTGTVSTSGTSVTGSSSKFLTEFRIGDTITVLTESQVVATVSSDTALTVTSAFAGAGAGASGATATRAATPRTYIYPNGSLQVGGTRTTVGSNLNNSNLVIMGISSAVSAGATSNPSTAATFLTYSGGGTATTQIALGRARGTEAAPAVVSASDNLGLIDFRGYGASLGSTSARIIGQAAETFSGTALGASLLFQTVPVTTTGLVTRWTIGQAGSLEGTATASAAESATVVLNEKDTTPAAPTQDTQVKMYFKTNAIVFEFNDGGTTRYKYLDLTGTGVTWTHSTSAP
jgi:hypothetical protein